MALAAGDSHPEARLAEGFHHLQREREDDGGVLLSRDAAQCLEVPQLQSCRGLADRLRSLSQSSAGLLLSLRRHYLGPGFPRGLGLCRHHS